MIFFLVVQFAVGAVDGWRQQNRKIKAIDPTGGWVIFKTHRRDVSHGVQTI
jgi:hypothetical protein